jgi:hypothetical protein
MFLKLWLNLCGVPMKSSFANLSTIESVALHKPQALLLRVILLKEMSLF